MKDLSIAQTQLLIWSAFYQGIVELPSGDKPPEEIIENDERLDEYMKKLDKKLTHEDRLNFNKNSKIGGTTLSAQDHEQVIVSAESKNYITFSKEKLFDDPKKLSGRQGNKTNVSENKKRSTSKK